MSDEVRDRITDRLNAQASDGCCRNAEWRGHLCQYHQGYDDGMKPPLVVYHDNCPDGFGSAWWLGKWIGDHEKFGASYKAGEALPDFTDRSVYIVDFCYPTDVLNQIIEQANSLLILDHHKTAFDYTNGVYGLWCHNSVETFFLNGPQDDKFHAVLDMDHSGVGLVAEYVEACFGEEPPEFFWHLEDRDLWNFQNHPTPERSYLTPLVFAAVTSSPYAEEAWNLMWEMEFSELVAAGAGIERYRQKLISEISDTAYLANMFGHEVWCVSAPYAVGSDVAGILCRRDPDRPFAAYYVDYGDRLKYGLRSLEEGADVASLAQTVGGGGHKHASGFEVVKWGPTLLPSAPIGGEVIKSQKEGTQ